LPLLKDISPQLSRIEKAATDFGPSHAQRGLYRCVKAKRVLKGLERRFRALESNVPLFAKRR
jgi:hypothetical protein